MHSFRLIAIGYLGRDPEVRTRGDLKYTRFCLVASVPESSDRDGETSQATKLWFSAFGALGERIARHVRSGDQLVVEAGVEGRFFTDRAGKRRQDTRFVAMGFKFGAPGPATRALFDAQEDAGYRPERDVELVPEGTPASCLPAF